MPTIVILPLQRKIRYQNDRKFLNLYKKNNLFNKINEVFYVINKASIRKLIRKVYGGMPGIYHRNPKIVSVIYVTNKASIRKLIRKVYGEMPGINHIIPKEN